MLLEAALAVTCIGPEDVTADADGLQVGVVALAEAYGAAAGAQVAAGAEDAAHGITMVVADSAVQVLPPHEKAVDSEQ